MSATYLTKQGLKKLEQELKTLQSQRHKLLEEVNRAAAMGDLRENAEYHAARERAQHVSKRLAELDSKLTNVQLVDDLQTAAGEARVGMQVTLKDLGNKEQCTYQLVGPDEADPPNGKLSIASPIGKSLLGKKEKDEVVVTLPTSQVTYRILKVVRPIG